MLRKKLNNILFTIGLASFVLICSCNPNEVETGTGSASSRGIRWIIG